MIDAKDNNLYLDLQSLDSLRQTAQRDQSAALEQVAGHFEAMFTGMLVQHMRQASSVFESDSPLNGRTIKFYQQMADQQMVENLAQQGGLGLKPVLMRQLSALIDPNDQQGYAVPERGLSLGDGAAPAYKINPRDFVHLPNTRSNPSTDAEQGIEFAPEISMGKGDFSLPTREVTPPKPQAASVTDASASAVSAPAHKQAAFSSPEEFVQALLPYAREAAKKLGQRPEVLIAQAALETGWGKKLIHGAGGLSSNNLFNIKAHRDWDGATATVNTLEYVNGIAVQERSPFRMYQNFAQSFTDFVDFLNKNGRYQTALAQRGNSASFLHELQKAGYATDPQYANKILQVMKHPAFAAVGE